MTDAVLNKANKLKKSYETLEVARKIFCYPYPHFFFPKKKFVFYYGSEDVSFSAFDDETREGLEKVIYEYIVTRQEQIRNELKDL